VVAGGFAETADPVVGLNPVAGDHEYVEAPPAVKDPGVPAQIVIGEEVITGIGFTVTVTVAVAVHPSTEVPVTV
jgi:hypothetical protein